MQYKHLKASYGFIGPSVLFLPQAPAKRITILFLAPADMVLSEIPSADIPLSVTHNSNIQIGTESASCSGLQVKCRYAGIDES